MDQAQNPYTGSVGIKNDKIVANWYLVGQVQTSNQCDIISDLYAYT